MWNATKSKKSTTRSLTKLAASRTGTNNSGFRSRRTPGRGVAKIVRDDYGSASEWFALCKQVRKRDNYRCVKCNDPECPSEGLFHEVHHIRPLSKGGTTTLANLILLCKNCHKGRHKHMRRSR